MTLTDIATWVLPGAVLLAGIGAAAVILARGRQGKAKDDNLADS